MMEVREMVCSSCRHRSAKFAVGALLLAVAMTLGGAAEARAQSARYRVLIPSFETDNPRSRDGRQLAEQVRRHVDQMPTHASVDARTVRNGLRQFGLREEQMNCAQWQKLATHVGATLVLCGSIEDATRTVHASFITLGGDSFEVPSFTMESIDQAARRVVQEFGTYVRQLALTVFCHDHLQGGMWQAALDACNQAIELNPGSTTAHYARGSALSNLDRLDEALDAFQSVLRIEPLNQDALMHAGILAARIGRQDESQRYFQQYLELNPGDEQVRLKIATDLANAGDPAGALMLVEAAMDTPAASGLLWEYAGHFAMNAGMKLSDAGPASGEQAEANRFYRTAIQHYERAVQQRGDSIDLTVFRNLMLAHHRLGEAEQALRYGQRATTMAPADAQAWMVYADVLSGAQRINDALHAYERAAAADPGLPNISARRAVLLLEAGRLSDAVTAVRAGIERRDIQPDLVESISQRMSYTGYQVTQAERFEQALPYFGAARDIGKSDLSIAMANFFHGYTLLKQGEAVLKTTSNAASARRARPLLERSKVLLEGAGAYTAQAATRAQLLQQLNQLMEHADALIRIGR
jgi:tetratricopeptide (TPR) repeat protein